MFSPMIFKPVLFFPVIDIFFLLVANTKPVGSLGGGYKPLSEKDVKKLYNLALDALADIRLGLAPQSGINYMTKAGAQLGDDGRVRFPKSLVEDMIGLSSKDLTLFGREEKFDMHLSGKKCFLGLQGQLFMW